MPEDVLAAQRPIRSPLAPAMLIGIPSIDKAHEELLWQLDRLMSNPDAPVNSEPFSEVLSQLGLAITAHFRDEENIFKALPMPEDLVASHVQAHTDILRQYAQLNFDLMNGMPLGRSGVLAKIREWILGHLLEHDLRIRDFLATPATAPGDRVEESR
ncbi:MAG: hemerythrin family protein [Propionivibrio sp.]